MEEIARTTEAAPRGGAAKGELRIRATPAIALLAYMGVIFALSHQSQPPLPAALLAVSDKVLHAAEYLPLGFLLARVLGPAGVSRVLLAWGAAVFFGATDEFHQSFVPGRDASVFDLAADAVGSGVGVWFAYLWDARRRRRPNNSSPTSTVWPD